MRRLFYAGKLAENITIRGGDAHHLARVMRVQAGDAVVVAGADGTAARMTVAAVGRDAVDLALAEYLPAEEEDHVEVILVQALLKGEKMDFVVQKAAELGAAAVYPVETEHIVARYDAKKAAAKAARWQKIADEAAKQCGRRTLMTIAPITALSELLQDEKRFGAPDTAVVFCYEQERRQSMRMVLQGITAQHVILIVGAEGGFSRAEAEAVTAAGGQAVSLGRRILRAETAALTVLALAQYEFGNFDIQ